MKFGIFALAAALFSLFFYLRKIRTVSPQRRAIDQKALETIQLHLARRDWKNRLENRKPVKTANS